MDPGKTIVDGPVKKSVLCQKIEKACVWNMTLVNGQDCVYCIKEKIMYNREGYCTYALYM